MSSEMFRWDAAKKMLGTTAIGDGNPRVMRQFKSLQNIYNSPQLQYVPLYIL